MILYLFVLSVALVFKTRAPPTGAGRSTFSYLILNCKQFTKLYILLTCQQIGVNTFYKSIEFQVNSFDSKLLRNFNYTKKISQISMYYVETRADNSGYTNHRVTCLVVMGSPFGSEQVHCMLSFISMPIIIIEKLYF